MSSASARRRLPSALVALVVALGLVLAGCATTPGPAPSVVSPASAPAGTSAEASAASPSATRPSAASPSAALPASAWVTATVEQPAAISAVQSDAPAFCSPCHPALGTYVSGLVRGPGGYYAFGYSSPPATAAAWFSADAVSWRRIASFPAGSGTLVLAAVASPSGILAVGQRGRAAAVWRSADGSRWTLAALPAPGSGVSEQMTAVARVGSGFVAAGYTENAVATRTAAFWRSADGASWTRLAVPAPAATEVTGLATLRRTVVAVGVSGDERRGRAAAWRSTDAGATWAQLPASPSLDAGRMLAVAAREDAAPGPAFVAVGETTDQTAAAAWYSADGSSWQATTAQLGLANGGLEMVMTAVAAESDGGWTAVGWKSDAGNGSAAVWRSADGSTWTRLPDDPSFSGAGMSTVLTDPRLVAAGTMGWPDTHAALVWLGPS